MTTPKRSPISLYHLESIGRHTNPFQTPPMTLRSANTKPREKRPDETDNAIMREEQTPVPENDPFGRNQQEKKREEKSQNKTREKERGKKKKGEKIDIKQPSGPVETAAQTTIRSSSARHYYLYSSLPDSPLFLHYLLPLPLLYQQTPLLDPHQPLS